MNQILVKSRKTEVVFVIFLAVLSALEKKSFDKFSFMKILRLQNY